MATIQKDILEEFYKRLSKSDGFTEAIVKQVQDLFDGSKKPKAADLAKIFSSSSEDSLP
jgi:hypothetical protein